MLYRTYTETQLNNLFSLTAITISSCAIANRMVIHGVDIQLGGFAHFRNAQPLTKLVKITFTSVSTSILNFWYGIAGFYHIQHITTLCY